uniref:Uncharacterized protein n=1 Tax=Pelodiscus sinensis TaxID=13735 RepID=K7G6B0_PELSI
MFYYQDVETPETGPPGIGPNPHSTSNKKPKVFVTEGIDVALTGICIIFIRSSPSKDITAENIHREVNFNMLDTAQGGLLKSVQNLLSEIFIPVLKTMNQGWSEIGDSQQRFP